MYIYIYIHRERERDKYIQTYIDIYINTHKLYVPFVSACLLARSCLANGTRGEGSTARRLVCMYIYIHIYIYIHKSYVPFFSDRPHCLLACRHRANGTRGKGSTARRLTHIKIYIYVYVYIYIHKLNAPFCFSLIFLLSRSRRANGTRGEGSTVRLRCVGWAAAAVRADRRRRRCRQRSGPSGQRENCTR